MVAKRRKKKRVTKSIEVSEKGTSQDTPAEKYIISGRFTWKGLTHNVGEELPPFIPVAMKDDLWKQGKLDKIGVDGVRIRYRAPKVLAESEMYAMLVNPVSTKEWLSKFDIDVQSLKMLLAHYKTKGIDEIYTRLIEEEINGKKEESSDTDGQPVAA